MSDAGGGGRPGGPGDRSGEGPTALYGVDAPPADRRAAFAAGEVPVAVHGLGRIGAPVAAVFAETTGAVTGVDVDPEVVAAVENGESPVDEPGLDSVIADLVAAGALTATTDPAAVEAGVHVLVVPTLLADGDPDLSALLSATRAVGRTLSPGDLVVVESTVPPGTCAEAVRPALAEESGLDPSAFGVAHCPERTASGRALRDVRGAYPRVVGGVDEESTRAAAAVYDELVDDRVLRAPDARTAECVKLFEGVYRDVNIALANDLALAAGDLGVDVRTAIDLANTQPYCDLHDPGPGVGGHCIPYYPHFLTSAVESGGRLVRTARSVNDRMPAHVVGELVSVLGDREVAVGDAAVLVAGLTYRPGVTGTTESPARGVADMLEPLVGARYGLDPVLAAARGPAAIREEFDLEPVGLADLPDLSSTLDAAVVVTPHDAIVDLDWERLDPMVVLDGRDGLDLGDTHHHVVVLGDGSGRDGETPGDGD